jgi:hypothetical protein
VPTHEVYVWMKEVTSSNSRVFDASYRHEFKKACFVSSGIIPSQSCMCEVFYGLIGWPPPFHMYFLAHQATDCFVQGEEVPS